MNRTLVIVKPDGVERGLVGEIVGRLERKGLRLVAAELRTIAPTTAARPLRRAPGQALLRRPGGLHHPVAGRWSWWSRAREDTYAVVRTLMGPTNPDEAAPGTIRGDLAIELTENLVHGSDSAESAAREIGLFFPDLA